MWKACANADALVYSQGTEHANTDALSSPRFRHDTAAMAHRAHSQDLRELEKWIDFNTGWSKAREEFVPMARGREAAMCKVLSTCFEELVQQTALFNPAVAKCVS